MKTFFFPFLLLLLLLQPLCAQEIREVTFSTSGDNVLLNYTLIGDTSKHYKIVAEVDPINSNKFEELTGATGSVGSGISPGSHTITWPGSAVRAKLFQSEFPAVVFRVSASEELGPSERVNGQSFTMIAVPAGSFTMGSDIEEDEKPAHRIAINRFYLGQTEVTQALWRAVMGTNPSYTKNCDACPVESVNWTDIQDFIERLNQLTGKQYRLPTEAEWEYAAGGGASGRTKYAGTNDEGSITNYAWYTGNSSVKTHPVGTKSANALGLFDMSGNVGELCQDWYYFRYYENSPAVDPVNTELGTYYVVRGGGWSATFKQCRVAARGNSLPDNRDKLVGFRLARSPE